MLTHDRTKDYLFRGDLAELDPDIAALIRHETTRQARYLIMIPSESTIPQAVREALASPFVNLYAEGYPLDETRQMTEREILDYSARLPEYRRSADNRYYKGTEYANIVEALARRRVAEAFATAKYDANHLFVNVQPLSGAPANAAVYTALLKPGDVVMGMDLLHGGHLTHGSPVNRSGKFYQIVSYSIHPDTENIDYDQMRRLALEHRPKLIIGGYSSFPLAPDWRAYRAIADEVGAVLLADIAHVAGLVIAGEYPSPVGIADVVSFTTHKTLNGPRGAVLITHNKALSDKIDRGVFPGEQGGPHVNQIAALAVAMRLTQSEQFHELQRQTVRNARRLAEQLAARDIRICYGGTDSHMLTIDVSTIKGADGTALSGDMAARILDLAGIVANRQTIPGDTSALRPSGVRLGTPWITQRGFHEPEIDLLAANIADLLHACKPFTLTDMKRPQPRSKVDFATLHRVRNAIRDLSASVGIDSDVPALTASDDYPHFSYLQPDSGQVDWRAFDISGERAADFLHMALTSDVYALAAAGEQQPTWILDWDGAALARGVLARMDSGYRLYVERNPAQVAAWLRSLSDGFVLFDKTDEYARVPGPVTVADAGALQPAADLRGGWSEGTGFAQKAYSIGMHGAAYAGPTGAALPEFTWTEPAEGELKRTSLYDLHRSLNARMVPFAGYDMPVWYTSVSEEHMAVRTGAGIFDVAHMGVFDVRGAGAAEFLNTVTTNDVLRLEIGESHYTYLLDIRGIPVDDLMIYRVTADRYLVVVNASNNDKNWAWLQAIIGGQVQINPAAPWARIGGSERFELRDLRDPAVGAERRVDLALQGPQSKNILLALGGSDADKAKVSALPWAGVTQVTLGGFDLIVSRTGYTGERIAYELFVHPDHAAALFKALVDGGAIPCGLAARDSLRTEAGLPLYGHELAGDLGLNPADAGFAGYVKLYKPFFIGKAAFIAHERVRDAEVTRFRMDAKGVRPPHPGDPIVDKKGRVVGIVTSCSIDSEGYQLGQAYLKGDFLSEGTPVAVFPGSAKAKASSVAGLKLGDKALLPEPATVLSRFPKRK